MTATCARGASNFSIAALLFSSSLSSEVLGSGLGEGYYPMECLMQQNMHNEMEAGALKPLTGGSNARVCTGQALNSGA